MKKPKPRHLKKEIAKQLRAMDLTPRQMRAAAALAELRPSKGVTCRVIPDDYESTLSAFPVSQARQEMFERHGALNREALSSPRLKPVRNLGEVEGSGILPPEMDPEVLRDILDASVPANLANIIDRDTHHPLGLSDPGRAKDRDFTKLAVKATPEQLGELGKDMKLIFKDGVQVAGTGWSVDHDGDIDHIPPKAD